MIPTHGRPDFLAEAIESVLRQRLPVSELVVVDDLGTPETQELVESFATRATGVAVSYFHRVTGSPGASESRNAGFSETSTPLVAFLDDDDIWSPNHLLSAVNRLRESNAGLSLSWMEVAEPDGFVHDHFSPADGLHAEDVMARNPGITGSNLVVRRAEFETISGFDPDLPVSNDKDFLVRYLAANLTYVVVRERTVLHRRHHQGQLTAWDKRRAVGLAKYIDKHSARLSRQDRRYLKRQIDSIRFRTETGFRRLAAAVVLVTSTPPRELIYKARERAKK
ncbi:glycosyltransferase family 2 protein [Microbacterium sp. P05]|uniref:glycosyltransferase family 2 protein n=1 Tax=Microbacterium sp. P05 TaxID=3366948 RepID=UPI0037453032